jgi:hypothetical protein
MMAGVGSQWWDSRLIQMALISLVLVASVFVLAKESMEQEDSNYNVKRLIHSLWQPDRLGYVHVWPVSPTSVVFSNHVVIIKSNLVSNFLLFSFSFCI